MKFVFLYVVILLFDYCTSHEVPHPELMDKAWHEIRSPYPLNITVIDASPLGGTDKVKIVKKENQCFIVSKQSDDAGDWIRNMEIGKEYILSSLSSGQYEYCGCKIKRFYFLCKEYHTCYKRYGQGYHGFVIAYNHMRLRIRELFEQLCSDVSIINYVGYSRGGAISTILAYAHKMDGLITSKQSINLITFGAPRVLEKKDASEIQLFLTESYRAVRFGRDMISSLPPAWFGNITNEDELFYHVGKTIIPDTVSMNGPDAFSTFDFEAHFHYDDIYLNTIKDT